MDGMHTTATAEDLERPGTAIAEPGHLGSTVRAASPAGASETAKRAVDIVFGTLLLIALSPLIGTAALLIRLTSGPQILIRHQRVGRHGVAFPCLKFRTMVRDGDRVLAEHLSRDPAAREEWRSRRKLTKDPRVTMLGHVLRRLSIDELPQLMNVLRGEMSLVGPRPVVEAELAEHYRGEAERCYCQVRPGLTGLWQVSGRSDVSYRERVRLDMEYARRRSLALDLRIMLRTPLVVLRARGAC